MTTAGSAIETPSGIPSVVGTLSLTQTGVGTVRVAWGGAFRANGPITSYVLSTVPDVGRTETLPAGATQTVFETSPSDPYLGSIEFRVTAVSAAGESAPITGYVVVTINGTTTAATATTTTTTGDVQEAQAAKDNAVSGGGIAAIVIILLLLVMFVALALLIVRTKSKVVAGSDAEFPSVASE